MTFINELKKRNVFKVGAAYAVVAWLLVQAADVFFPALHLPDWAITLVAGLVLLGFPIALLLAWAYEITPGGIVPASEIDSSASAAQAPGQRFNYLILGLVALAVLVLLVDRYALNPRSAVDGRTPASGTDTPAVIAGAVNLPAEAPLASGTAAIGFDSPVLALSPDNSVLVYVGTVEGRPHLFRHRLDGFDPPELILGTEDAKFPFFSPDGKFIGFLTSERLKYVPVDGDNVQGIASVKAPVSANWAAEDLIYVVNDQGNSLQRVEVRSGNVESAAETPNVFFSDVLPGGQFAFGVTKDTSIAGDYAEIVRLDLANGNHEPLGVSGFDARWIPGGYMMFGRNGSVYIARIDPETAELIGEPHLAVPDVAMDSIFAQVQVAVSPGGTMAFVPGADRALGQIVVVTRDGAERKVAEAPQKFGVLELSSDDRLLALHMTDVKDYISIFDLALGEGRKLAGSDGFGWPKYSRTGSLALTGVSIADIGTQLLVVPDDQGAPGLTLDLPAVESVVSDWSPDGVRLAMTDWNASQVVLLDADGQGELTRLPNSSIEWGGVFSPDGDWLAYSSDETGRFEIWIRSLAEPERKRQVSVNGGIEPVWCPCGKIFYRRGNQFWSAQVEIKPEITILAKEPAFTVTDFLDTPGRSYDISSDGELLYTIKRAEPAILDRIHILANWLDSLEHLGSE